MTCFQLEYDCPLEHGKDLTSPCPFALNAIKKIDSDSFVKLWLSDKIIFTDGECDWYVLDEKSHYCVKVFWSNPDNIKSYTLEEISKLLGLCPASVMHIQNRAMNKVKTRYDLVRRYGLVKLNKDKKNVYSPKLIMKSHKIGYNKPVKRTYIFLFKPQIEVAPQLRDISELIGVKLIQKSVQLQIPMNY